MFIFKKLMGDIEVTRDLILLMVIGGLYSLSIALSNTFVNIYLWKQSQSFLHLGLYNLSIVVLQLLTFILAGRWAKKVDRVIVLRIGVIFLALFYCSVLIIGNSATHYLFLLGSLLGIGSGFYWLGFNVLTFEITEPDTRDFFNGTLGVLNSFGGMIGPIVSGFIISRFVYNNGYTIVFALSLILFALAVFLSFSIKRRPAEGKYCFTRILKERANNRDWRLITTAHFFQGIREGTFLFVVSVYVFIETGSELALGTFGLLNSGVAFIAYYFASRYIKGKNRVKFILIGGILLFAAVFLLIHDVTYTKLLIYAMTIAIAYPILLVPYISMTYDIIGRGWNAAEMRIEYIVVKELFLNGGRIASVLSFLITVKYFDLKTSLPVLLIILGSGHSFIYWFVRKIEHVKT